MMVVGGTQRAKPSTIGTRLNILISRPQLAEHELNVAEVGRRYHHEGHDIEPDVDFGFLFAPRQVDALVPLYCITGRVDGGTIRQLVCFMEVVVPLCVPTDREVEVGAQVAGVAENDRSVNMVLVNLAEEGAT